MSSTTTPSCRICTDTSAPLITPCLCANPVHAHCLTEWLSHRSSLTFPPLTTHMACEVCKQTLPSLFFPTFANSLFNVETCLFIFLFVLAIMGHVLYVINIYGGGGMMYGRFRMILGVVNAVVVGALLILARRIVGRWVREDDFFTAVAGVLDAEDDVEAQNERAPAAGSSGIGGAARWSRVCKALWGGGVCVVGGLEMFMLMRELPLLSELMR